MSRTVYLGALPDLRGLVVTPNRSAASSLGVTGITLESLARQAVTLEVASSVRSRQLLMHAVREVLGECDALGFARFFAPAVRELLRLDADLDVVASCGGRSVKLAEVTKAFKHLLAEKGLIDAPQVFFEAARTVQRVQVTLTGYPRLGLGELTFLDALAGDGSQLALPFVEDALFTENSDAAAFLEARGWSSVREPAAQTWTTCAPTHALAFANQEAEVRGVLGRVNAYLDEGVRPSDIALVVRDEALYGPLILAVAREYGLEVAAYYAVPLKNTRVGSFVGAFIAMLRGAYAYEATTRFLAHPLTDRLDSALWAQIREAHPQRLAAWGTLGIDLPTLPSFATRTSFSAVLAEFWNAFELRLPREQAALKSLTSALESLDGETTLSRDAFLAELDDTLHALTVPVKPGRGVSVHTPLAVLGAALSHMFVLGLAEGTFPAPLRDDAALDFFERKTLRSAGVNVETAPYAAWREQLSFHSLVAHAKASLTLSYPQQLDGQPAKASHYFRVLGLTPEVSREVYLVSEQERQRASLQDEGGAKGGVGAQALKVERSREAAGAFDAFDGVTGVAVDVSNHVFSATQLTHLLSCPFKWFAAYVLEAGPPAEFEEDALFTGNLYHKTLQLLAERTQGAADIREAMLESVEAAFADAEALEGVPDLPAWSGKRLELIATLRSAIASPGFIAEDALITETEQHFVSTWQGFKVRGRLDRLDRTPDGYEITDYKTSRYISKPDVQLSIYETAVRERYPDESVRARYFSLKYAEVISSHAPDDLEERLAEAKKALASGVFPPVASDDNCAYCDFDLLCRKGPRLKDKYLDKRPGEEPLERESRADP